MLTILCWPHLNAQRILLCLRSQFISASRDPKTQPHASTVENPTSLLQRSNTKLHHSTEESQLTLFKIFKFSEPSLLGMTSSTLQPYFLSGGLLWQIVSVISFTRECKTAPSDSAPGLRDKNSSKPYQTEC